MRSSSVAVVSHEASLGPLQHDRLPQLDAARVIAVFAIVWIHTPRSVALAPTIALARFAVPFFVITSVLLILKGFARRPERSIRQFAVTRLRRLGLPFVAWTVIYLLFKLLKRVIAPHQPNNFPGWEVAGLGSAYHLWFLPFLLLVSLFVGTVARRVVQSQHPPRLAASSALMCVIIATMPFPPIPAFDSKWDGLRFMWLATPAIFAAIPVYFLLQRPVDQWHHRLAPSALWMVLLASTLYVAMLGRNSIAETIAGSSFLMLVVQVPHHRCVDWLARLAPLTYGVYLSHLLFLKVGESVAARLQWSASPALDLGLFTLAIWGSTSLSWMLSRFRATRWLIG